MPSPSAPSTKIVLSGSFVANRSPPPRTTVATIENPAPRSCAMALSSRPRRTNGTISAPPSATRAAAPDSARVDCFGNNAATAPKCAAERRIAPRLCGLPTPSSHSAQHGPGGSSRSHGAIDSGSSRSTSAITPSWWALAASFCRSSCSTTR